MTALSIISYIGIGFLVLDVVGHFWRWMRRGGSALAMYAAHLFTKPFIFVLNRFFYMTAWAKPFFFGGGVLITAGLMHYAATQVEHVAAKLFFTALGLLYLPALKTSWTALLALRRSILRDYVEHGDMQPGTRRAFALRLEMVGSTAAVGMVMIDVNLVSAAGFFALVMSQLAMLQTGGTPRKRVRKYLAKLDKKLAALTKELTAPRPLPQPLPVQARRRLTTWL